MLSGNVFGQLLLQTNWLDWLILLFGTTIVYFSYTYLAYAGITLTRMSGINRKYPLTLIFITLISANLISIATNFAARLMLGMKEFSLIFSDGQVRQVIVGPAAASGTQLNLSIQSIVAAPMTICLAILIIILYHKRFMTLEYS